MRRLDNGPAETAALTSVTHLTQVSEAMLLRYPLHRLRVGCDLDRPVVSVNRRLADLEQRSQPHCLQKHRVGSQVSSEHLRKVLVWRAGAGSRGDRNKLCLPRMSGLFFTVHMLLSGYRFNMAAADRLQSVCWQLK